MLLYMNLYPYCILLAIAFSYVYLFHVMFCLYIVRRKDLMTKRLTQELDDLKQAHEMDLDNMLKQYEMNQKYNEKIFLEKERTLLEKNDNLQQQISSLAELAELRAQLAADLLQTKQVIFQNERTHILQLDELEKKFLQARDKLQQEATDKILYARSQFKKEVAKELEEESGQIRTQNQVLNEQLKLYEHTSDRLQYEYSEWKKKIQEKKRENDLLYEKLQTYEKKKNKQQALIDTLTEETQQLEMDLMNVSIIIHSSFSLSIYLYISIYVLDLICNVI